MERRLSSRMTVSFNWFICCWRLSISVRLNPGFCAVLLLFSRLIAVGQLPFFPSPLSVRLGVPFPVFLVPQSVLNRMNHFVYIRISYESLSADIMRFDADTG